MNNKQKDSSDEQSNDSLDRYEDNESSCSDSLEGKNLFDNPTPAATMAHRPNMGIKNTKESSHEKDKDENKLRNNVSVRKGNPFSIERLLDNSANGKTC